MVYPHYVCWLGENIIAEADTLEELRELLDWQVDEDNIDAVDCYDTDEQDELDVYEVLGLYKKFEEMLREYEQLVQQSLKVESR